MCIYIYIQVILLARLQIGKTILALVKNEKDSIILLLLLVLLASTSTRATTGTTATTATTAYQGFQLTQPFRQFKYNNHRTFSLDVKYLMQKTIRKTIKACKLFVFIINYRHYQDHENF